MQQRLRPLTESFYSCVVGGRLSQWRRQFHWNWCYAAWRSLPHYVMWISGSGEGLPKTSHHIGNASFCASALCTYRRLLLLLVLANFHFPSAVFDLFRAPPAVLSFVRQRVCLLYCLMLALACAVCCIIQLSISLRLSLMISTALYRATSCGSGPCLNDKSLLPFHRSSMCPHLPQNQLLPLRDTLVSDSSAQTPCTTTERKALTVIAMVCACGRSYFSWLSVYPSCRVMRFPQNGCAHFS